MLMHLLCFLIDVLTKVKHHTIVVTKVTTTSPPSHAIMSGPSIDEQVRGALPASGENPGEILAKPQLGKETYTNYRYHEIFTV